LVLYVAVIIGPWHSFWSNNDSSL